MKIVVGVVGTAPAVNDVLAQSQCVPDVELLPLPYNTVDESPELVRRQCHRLHAVCYTGPIPHAINAVHAHFGLAATHISFTGSVLLKAMIAAYRAGLDLTRLSIDTLSESTVYELFADLGISPAGVRVLEFRPGLTTADLVAFHHGLWQSGAVSGGITFLATALRELVQLGVPVVRQTADPETIRATLRMARSLGESVVLRNWNLAIGILTLDNFDDIRHRLGCAYKVQQAKLRVHEALLHFSRAINSSLVALDNDTYAFYTTRGSIEAHLHSGLPSLPAADDRYPVTSSLGLGLGRTAHQAEAHARLALDHARRYGGGCAFLVTEERVVSGPLGTSDQTSYSSASSDPGQTRLAASSGLSVATLSRVQGLVRSSGKDLFTVWDLASGLRVSRRTAHRMLAALCRGGGAEPAGSDQPGHRGRPRTVYRLVL